MHACMFLNNCMNKCSYESTLWAPMWTNVGLRLGKQQPGPEQPVGHAGGGAAPSQVEPASRGDRQVVPLLNPGEYILFRWN